MWWNEQNSIRSEASPFWSGRTMIRPAFVGSAISGRGTSNDSPLLILIRRGSNGRRFRKPFTVSPVIETIIHRCHRQCPDHLRGAPWGDDLRGGVGKSGPPARPGRHAPALKALWNKLGWTDQWHRASARCPRRPEGWCHRTVRASLRVLPCRGSDLRLTARAVNRSFLMLWTGRGPSHVCGIQLPSIPIVETLPHGWPIEWI
jgi:hypothetical protein